MRTFAVLAPAPPLVPPASGSLARLGRLGPPLVWLATAQGSWPPRLPAAVRRVVADDGGPVEPALAEGVRLADEAADSGVDLLLAGSEADQVAGVVVAAALLDLEPVTAVGTSGAGGHPGWAALTVGVRDGLRAARPHIGDPKGLLAAVPSPALSRLTGLLAQSAVRRTSVIFDGSPISCGAALVAERLAPGASAWWLAGQWPPNPAARLALDHLGLFPLLDLGLDLAAGADLARSVLEQAIGLVRDDTEDGASVISR